MVRVRFGRRAGELQDRNLMRAHGIPVGDRSRHRLTRSLDPIGSPGADERGRFLEGPTCCEHALVPKRSPQLPLGSPVHPIVPAAPFVVTGDAAAEVEEELDADLDGCNETGELFESDGVIAVKLPPETRRSS